MSYLIAAKKQFLYYKKLADGAMQQINEEQFFVQPNEESNSIALIVKHLAGNMLSRWTDFLTTDGEKPWRNRDGEFVDAFKNNREVLDYWEKGWDCLFKTLETLTEKDLETIVYIRNEGHTVLEAITRQLCHYASHCGQIIYLAKWLKNTDWQSLSIPRNKSLDYNSKKFSEEKGTRHFTDGA